MTERLLFLDFETYYDDVYSLRKMPTPNYILDDRFEMICCAVKEGAGPAHVIDGPDFPKFIAGFDPAHTTTVTFNALFDNSILAWRYGFIPHLMLDSMGMARALRGHILPSASLAVVAKHLGLGEKGDTLIKVKGMHREDIIHDYNVTLWSEFKRYAIQDNELSAAIFYMLYKEFPVAERHIMDLVLRCTIEPQFRVDIKMLEAHLADVRAEKQGLLQASGVTRADLMSGPKFKAALEALGVEVEMKPSPKEGRPPLPAVAKSDEFMSELLEHEDERVRALAEARLGFKSTIEETRAAKFLAIAGLPWQDFIGITGAMPMPLRYGAAHTTRLGGEWGMNVQNLPTARGSKGKSKLRAGLIAPPGHIVSAADLGQIEARITAWICGDTELLKQFADKLDPYALLAEEIFGYKIDRKVQIPEGFIGKTGVLGLGYGAGVPKFFNMVITDSRKYNIDLKGMWTQGLAEKTVATYRRARKAIVRNGWYRLDHIIRTAWVGKSGPDTFGPCVISKGRISLPNGLSLNYADPHWDPETQEFWYRYGRRRHKIYGAKMLENIVQALARIVVMNAALRIHAKGYRFALQGHDELVFILPQNDDYGGGGALDRAKQIIHTEMVRSPSWAPTVPLKAEAGAGASYEDAK
jgi:DNA polymerase family A